MKLSISSNANVNYLAKVVKLKGVKKHPNADKLQVVSIDFNDIITGMDAKDGDVYVYFPLECQLNEKFLVQTNSFSSQLLNKDTTVKGYFDKAGRVRATKLRGEKSMGYIVPVKVLEDFTGSSIADNIDTEFDTIGDILICKKYELPMKGANLGGNIGRKPKVSRLVDGQVHLHVDTERLDKNIYRLDPDDNITITYKLHGTSGWVSNVLVKRKLNIIESILKFLRVRIDDKEYDYVYGSRKVVKNGNVKETYNHFYDCDLWAEVKDELKTLTPKGFSIYYEIVGFTKSGGAIQPKYDYGCKQNEKKIFVYRITSTNSAGNVIDLSSAQVKQFCDTVGISYVPILFSGKVKDLLSDEDINNDWGSKFIGTLTNKYTDKDCYMCSNKVPEEGIVIRKESLFGFESYKLKSFRFLEYETEMLDTGEADIESLN